ncbi:IS1096 element passenger TnpR family protein [Bacillus sp. Marseille-P3661]|uniref:IS1096 element passenger TnpR family protein n=1 Tax=Bacillus sp. Marseille-P3661 TaxID=1936234 RepID=UPI000C82A7F5|nr:hypothetical protein [Bacillus sp. Marseille-P3661]
MYLKKEKDRVLYTYDYGDNWEHDIVLEKILPEEPVTYYPRCTKAMRAVPEEDSRFNYVVTGIVTETINQKEVLAAINEELVDQFGNESDR